MTAFQLCLLFLGLKLYQLLAITMTEADLNCRTKLNLTLEKLIEMSPEEIEDLEEKMAYLTVCIYKEMGLVDTEKGTLKEKEIVDFLKASSREAKSIVHKCIRDVEGVKNVDAKIYLFDICIQKRINKIEWLYSTEK